MRKPDDIRVGDTVYTPAGSIHKVVGAPSLLKGGTLRVLTPEEVRRLKEGDIVVDVRDGADCCLGGRNGQTIQVVAGNGEMAARSNITNDDIDLTNTFALKSLAEPNLPWRVDFEDGEKDSGWIKDADGNYILYFETDCSDAGYAAPEMIVEAVNAHSAPSENVVEDEPDPQDACTLGRYTARSVTNGWRIRDNQLNMDVKYLPFATQEEAMAALKELKAKDV